MLVPHSVNERFNQTVICVWLWRLQRSESLGSEICREWAVCQARCFEVKTDE